MTAHVSGAIALDSRIARFTRRVEDPTLLAGYALKEILDEMKVEVTGDVKSGGARVRASRGAVCTEANLTSSPPTRARRSRRSSTSSAR